jgi:hypothetical protein
MSLNPPFFLIALFDYEIFCLDLLGILRELLIKQNDDKKRTN